MYKGHEELGWKFAKMAWSGKFPVDEAFFTEWRKQISLNPVWQAIINNRAMPVSELKTALKVELTKRNNHE
jgi:hypothetical protein